MAKTIFVSYARADRAIVERLEADLKGCGHAPFFDKELTGGQSWWDEILGRIERCDVFVPVLSDAYLNSTACEREADYAIALGRPLLPVAIESMSPGLFTHRIAEAQWVVYDPADRDCLLNLVRAADTIPPPTAPPQPMPPRPEVPISYLTDLRGRIQAAGELSRTDQLRILAELKSRLHSDEADDARRLLRMLRQRPDLAYQVATDIDQSLGSPAAPPPGTPTTPKPPPTTAPPVAPAPPPPISRPVTPTAPKPGNYLVWSIVSALLCCLPLGAVGIYFAIQVDKRYAAGDLAGAQAASRQARTWTIVSFSIGLLGLLFFMVLAALQNS